MDFWDLFIILKAKLSIILLLDFIRMEEKKLLIIGCGRSGTLYSADVWRSLGLDIVHERDHRSGLYNGIDGIASWFSVVDDPNPPFGPSIIGQDFKLILHQVRHPLKVISSFAQFILQKGEKSPKFIEKHVPETRLTDAERLLDPQQQLILQAARYWFYWNELAEHKADKTIRLEDLKDELPWLCNYLGIKFQPNVVDNISKSTNSRQIYIKENFWKIDWKYIEQLDSALHDKIRDLACKYGYRED